MKYLINKLSAFLVMLMCMSATVQAEIVHHTVCDPTFSTRGFNTECWENTVTNKFYDDANCTNELRGSLLAQAVSYAKMPTSPITSIVGVSRFAGLRENQTLCDYNFNWAAVDYFQGDELFSSTVEFEVKEDNAANARLVWGIYQHPNATSGNLYVRIYVNGEIVYQDIRDWGNTLNVENLPNVTKGDNVRFVVWPELSTINFQFYSQIAVSLEYTFDCHHEFPTGSNTCSKCGYTLPENIVHHTVCEPTLSAPGYTRECWENLDNGKFYSDAACTQELTGAELAKTVVYAKLPSNPISGNSEFDVVEFDNTQTWGVNLNWAAETTFSNAYTAWSSTPRYAEFTVAGDNVEDARLVWMKNQQDVVNGRYSIKIYVKDAETQASTEVYSYTQTNNFEGVTIQNLEGLKKGDIVKFEVTQIAAATWHEAAPTFKACLEYTRRVPLTISAVDKQKFIGDEDPELTWEITEGELLSGDELTGIMICREKGENLGTYTINVSQPVSANLTYHITFVPATFTILPNDQIMIVTEKNGNVHKYPIEQITNVKWMYEKDLPSSEQAKIEDHLVPLTFIDCINGWNGSNGDFLVDGRPETNWVIEGNGNVIPSVTMKSDIPVMLKSYFLYTADRSNLDDWYGPSGWRIYAKLNIDDEWRVIADEMNPELPRKVTTKSADFYIEDEYANSYFQYFKFEVTEEIPMTGLGEFCIKASDTYMAIENADGSTTYIAHADVDDITWRLAENEGNANSMRMSFRKADVPEGLSTLSPEGATGYIDGREAIVVDLGGNIGKVAIATSNVGANNATEKGTEFYYSDANNPNMNGLINGWHVPTIDELQALLSRLTWGKIDEIAEPSEYQATVSFGNSTLILPSTGAILPSLGQVRSGIYLWSNASGYYMQIDDENKRITESNVDIAKMYVRPFCKLPMPRNLNIPVETEHSLSGSSLRFTEYGSGVCLTVNGQTVTYPLGILDKMTFFNGTPTVQLHANEDPDNADNYYTTFYSSLEAYSIPENVKAYTATVDGEVVKLTKIEGDILPQGEAVLLYSDATSDITMNVAGISGTTSSDNMFSGVDVETEQGGTTHYMLSYGQNKLGFYQMSNNMFLSPNKAFLPQSAAMANARAFRMVFADSEADGIEDVNVNEISNSAIYNLNGVRLDKLQKGINIVNGKKIFVK